MPPFLNLAGMMQPNESDWRYRRVDPYAMRNIILAAAGRAPINAPTMTTPDDPRAPLPVPTSRMARAPVGYGPPPINLPTPAPGGGAAMPDAGRVNRAMASIGAQLAQSGGNPDFAAISRGLSAMKESQIEGSRLARESELHDARMAESELRRAAEARRLAASDSISGALMGAYHPAAGGVPWTNPDTGKVSYGPRSKLFDDMPNEKRTMLASLAALNPEAAARVALTRNEAEAPKVVSVYDEKTGRDRKLQWNAKAGEWVKFGGVKARDDGPALTLTQQANNEEIKTARQYLRDLQGQVGPGQSLRDLIVERSRKATETGRDNPHYDPFIEGMAKVALQRMPGEDQEYQSFHTMFNASRPEPPPQATAAPADQGNSGSLLDSVRGLFGFGEPQPGGPKKTYINAPVARDPAIEVHGGAPAQPPVGAQPPPEAIDFLRANPHLAEAFDRKYGAGASSRFLSGNEGLRSATF